MNHPFSPSEVPSLCLQDQVRTLAFKSAIEHLVRPGDVVVDAGAGSGILTFFAARAGAKQVLAVEANELLCQILETNVTRNGFDGVIQVIHGDVREVDLPKNVDIVVAEMIETWLLDEHQVPALDTLRRKQVVSQETTVIPKSYDGRIAFGNLPFDFYGFDLKFPLHYWPDLKSEKSWLPLNYLEMTDEMDVFSVDFKKITSSKFRRKLEVVSRFDGEINVVRLFGIAHLGGEEFLQDTVTFNGDKLLPIHPTRIKKGQCFEVLIQGDCGSDAGLLDLQISIQV